MAKRNRSKTATGNSNLGEPQLFTYEGSRGDKLVMEHRLKSSEFDSKKNRWRFQAEITIEYEAEGTKKLLAESFEKGRRHALAKAGLGDVSFDEVQLGKTMTVSQHHRLMQETSLEIINDIFQPVFVTAYGFLISVVAHLTKPIVDRRIAEDCDDEDFREHAKVMAGHLPSSSDLEKKIGLIFRKLLKGFLKPYLRTAGRKYGTGNFKTSTDFLRALTDVLRKADKQPSQWETMYRLSRHPLWKGRALDREQCRRQTKTLRNWLEKAGIKDWEEALERYYHPARSGK